MAVMQRQYKVEGNTEVAGLTTLSFVENLSSASISRLREKHGLTEVDTEKWYPLQRVFDLFNDIVVEQGTQAFVAMGMKIAEASEFPPEMLGSELSMVQILEGWQAHYEANHRGDPLPSTQTVKVQDNHYKIILQKDHVYPFDLVYGMAYGFCRLLLPKGTPFKVHYDDQNRPALDQQTTDVILHVKWGAALK